MVWADVGCKCGRCPPHGAAHKIFQFCNDRPSFSTIFWVFDLWFGRMWVANVGGAHCSPNFPISQRSTTIFHNILVFGFIGLWFGHVGCKCGRCPPYGAAHKIFQFRNDRPPFSKIFLVFGFIGLWFGRMWVANVGGAHKIFQFCNDRPPFLTIFLVFDLWFGRMWVANVVGAHPTFELAFIFYPVFCHNDISNWRDICLVVPNDENLKTPIHADIGLIHV
jgi:hypothetical protein